MVLEGAMDEGVPQSGSWGMGCRIEAHKGTHTAAFSGFWGLGL